MAASDRGPMISIAAATGLVEAIVAAGQDPDRILRSVGLERAVFADRDAFIRAIDFARVLELTAHASGNEAFGLHFGARYHPKDVGILTYVIVNSPIMETAFGNAVRYLRVHNEAARVSSIRRARVAHLRHALPDVPFSLRRQHSAYSLALGVSTIRLMVGSEWAPLEVHFEHPAPSAPADYARVFNAPVLFGRGHNALVVDRELSEREVPAADRRLYEVVRREIERLLDELPVDDPFLATVRRAIAESLRQGDPQVGGVARRLTVSVRTLQRQLRNSGIDFKRLVDDTRHRLALRYIRHRRHTLTDVAYLLGYSEMSAFDRAFRRWTRTTPRAYRQSMARR